MPGPATVIIAQSLLVRLSGGEKGLLICVEYRFPTSVEFGRLGWIAELWVTSWTSVEL